MRQFFLKLSLPLLIVATVGSAIASELENDSMASVKTAEGLWEYTDLITRDGESLPLTGVFLIKNGIFLQQSIFHGDPFIEQGSMAHAGPYWAGGAGLRLRSNQTLSMDPAGTAPLSSAGAMEHDLKVTRDGSSLTLQFGGGTSTIQTFEQLGEANNARIHNFAGGNLALVDGYFILVIGDESSAVTGYGLYTANGDALTLQAIRWAESDGQSVKNLQDVQLSATLSETMFTLGDGRSFALTD